MLMNMRGPSVVGDRYPLSCDTNLIKAGVRKPLPRPLLLISPRTCAAHQCGGADYSPIQLNSKQAPATAVKHGFKTVCGVSCTGVGMALTSKGANTICTRVIQSVAAIQQVPTADTDTGTHIPSVQQCRGCVSVSPCASSPQRSPLEWTPHTGHKVQSWR